MIKSNIPALPRLPVIIPSTGGDCGNYFEEIICSDIFLIHNGSVENTVVSPVEEKVVLD